MAKVRVRYKGLSDIREITAEQLKPYGISLSRDLVWSADNLFAINIDMIPELEGILSREGTFTITEINDDGSEGDVVVAATVLDDTATAAVLKDATTGQQVAGKGK